jgi:hypothetical protein
MIKNIIFLSLLSSGICTVYAEPLSRVAPVDIVAAGVIGLDAVPVSLHPLFWESSYQERCRFAKGLKDNLSQAEVDALLTFITAAPEQVGLSRDYFNSVGDKVINALEAQATIPAALIDHLIAMFDDEAGNFTWRDYCVQHVGSLYATDAAAGKRNAMLQLFDRALEPETRMAGTAILALQRNAGEEGVAEEWVSELSRQVALDERQDESSRLTAMLVAAELGNREMLLLARDVIASRKPVQFRMAAMAVIGMLGDSSDLSLLEKQTASPDMRLRTASRAAIKKMNDRQQMADHKAP